MRRLSKPEYDHSEKQVGAAAALLRFWAASGHDSFQQTGFTQRLTPGADQGYT